MIASRSATRRMRAAMVFGADPAETSSEWRVNCPQFAVHGSAAQDQCAASKTIFCARQFKSSATYSSFSDGQAIS